MNQFNHLHIAGNLTHAPEVKTYNGRSYCSFQIANTRSWKDQNDEEKSAIDFIPVTARGAVADLITSEEITKGTFIEIEGTLRSSSSEKNGERITRVFITAFKITKPNSPRDTKTVEPLPDPDEIDPVDIPF